MSVCLDLRGTNPSLSLFLSQSDSAIHILPPLPLSILSYSCFLFLADTLFLCNQPSVQRLSAICEKTITESTRQESVCYRTNR